MEHYVSWVVFLIPIAGIVGGFTMAGLGIYAQLRRREFEHRERLAMIEKGIAPPSAMPRPAAEGTLATHADVWRGEDTREARLRRGGFILTAIGFGLALMIWTTSHETGLALGMGGFLVILGAAIFLSSFFGGAAGDRAAGPTEGSRR